MARKPDEEKAVDAIIAQLDMLDAAGLGRVADAAAGLQAGKKEAERKAFIARVREEAAAIGLSVEDLFIPTPTRKPTSGVSRKRGKGSVPVKYRSPDGKDAWTGRGKAPGWVLALEDSGLSRDKFLAEGGHDVGNS
jgi:DNA-binding protein H-NS